MPVSNEKTSNFLEAINKYAEEQRTKIQAEVEQFKKEELEKAETEILSDAYILIQKEMSQMRLAISSEVSRKSMDSRKELFEKRQGITAEVFQKAADRLAEFTKTADYPVLLEQFASHIAKVLTKPGAVLYIREQDASFAPRIEAAFGNSCTVRQTDDIVLGGIRGYHAEMGLVADETLDSRLEAQKEWFTENCGMHVV